MKRTIELYINGNRADLDANGLILMNYAFTDLEKPTAVKNSYSKQITLPGTATNSAIFGHICRVDRRTSTGFVAGAKTPFEAFNELGEKVLAGYLRLDNVVCRGNIVTGYKVTLFGGLGGFFYALSYDDNGDKRTLASLDYYTGGVDELDFKINATNVLAAWARLDTWPRPSTPQSIWDVINFAPAYNGIPDGNFSADKAIVKATDVGLAASKTIDGVTYQAQTDGSVLVNLAKAHTEWEVKDLRSYLQRPVLSMRAFMLAICNPANNGGYEVEMDEWIQQEVQELYKALPMLPSLSSIREEEGNYHLYSLPSVVTTSGSWAPVSSIQESVDTNTTITAQIRLANYFRVNDSTAGSNLYLQSSYVEGPRTGTRTYYYKQAIIFTQLLAVADGAVVAGSTIHCQLASARVMGKYTPSDIADVCGYTPAYAAEYEPTCNEMGNDGLIVTARSSHAPYGNFVGLGGITYQVEAVGVTAYRLAISCYVVEWHETYVQSQTGGGSGSGNGWRPPVLVDVTSYGIKPTLMLSSSESFATRSADGAWLLASTISGRQWYILSYRTSSEVRSGALIDKASLLSSKHTPAEYLISLVKILGGVFRYDIVAKKVYIGSRNAFYNTGQGVIDLTKRVDRSKDITITPLVAASKWYDFVLEQAQGSFATEYKAIYGVEAGIQRVNTGYEFDAKAQDMMDGNVYRQAITCLEHGPYYCAILVGSAFRPPVFIDKGNTYTLWSATDGKNVEIDIQRPPSSASIEYLNEYGHIGYDVELNWKLQLHDKENKPLDGEDILCYYSGGDRYPYFKVSDDTAVMASINDGTMCWDLNPGDSDGPMVPSFMRFLTNTEWKVLEMLDFGMAREYNIPYITFANDCTRYQRGWQAWMRDRLDQDTKVMKCRVDLSGLQVGPELLRRFYYYGGSIWVLNKISNYSLTTWDPAECEFIQVQDMANYTNGQILD